MRPVEPPKEEEVTETGEIEGVEAKDEQAQEVDTQAPVTPPPPPETSVNEEPAPVVLGRVNKNTGPRKLTKIRTRNLPSGKTKFVEGVE